MFEDFVSRKNNQIEAVLVSGDLQYFHIEPLGTSLFQRRICEDLN